MWGLTSQWGGMTSTVLCPPCPPPQLETLPPLTHPTTHPRDYRGGDTKRGEGGHKKVKKQDDFKIHFR